MEKREKLNAVQTPLSSREHTGVFSHQSKTQQHTNTVKEISSIPSTLSQLLMTELLHQNHNTARTL